MRFSTSVAAGGLLFASVTYAQLSVDSLSTSCQTAAAGLISSPIASCVNLVSLVSVLSASGSVIQPLNNWLGGACGQTCSSSVLANATSSIKQGCSSDLSSNNVLAEGLLLITQNYTEVKGLLCLEAKSNSTYCLTNLLTGIQNSTGTQVSTSTVTNILGNGVSGLTSLYQSIPASTLCTDCTHAQVSKISNFAKAEGQNLDFSDLSSKCGASFVDGSIPSTVSEGTGSSNSTGTTTSGGGSVSSSPLSAAGRSFDGLSSMLVASVVGFMSLTLLGAWSTLA